MVREDATVNEVPEERPKSIVKKLLPFTTAAMVIALIYVGYIFYSRRQDQKQAEQQATQKQAADARKIAEAYGGNELKILTFYATEGPIHRGESTQLCYGVSNAKSVKIEPDVHDVPPSYSNCVRVAPKKNTVFTLTAMNEAGKTEEASFELRIY
jgi:preprotein translocase subunit YajC